MRAVILGAGGIGGYVGARLAAAGKPAEFILRPGRAAQLARIGLRVASPLGDVLVGISLADPGPADLIVLACKRHDLLPALDTIAPFAACGTAIMPFLNGIAHLQAIRARFPDAQIWPGVAHIGVTQDDDGTIRHLGQDCRFWFGAMANTAEAHDPVRADALLAHLSAPGMQVELRQDIASDLWVKLTQIAALAGVTGLCRARLNTILQTECGPDTVQHLFLEASAVACAEHPQVDRQALQAALKQLTRPDASSGSSLLRDLLAGRPTEHEHLFGDLLAHARRHGVQTPLLAACHALLCAQAILNQPVKKGKE